MQSIVWARMHRIFIDEWKWVSFIVYTCTSIYPNIWQSVCMVPCGDRCVHIQCLLVGRSVVLFIFVMSGLWEACFLSILYVSCIFDSFLFFTFVPRTGRKIEVPCIGVQYPMHVKVQGTPFVKCCRLTFLLLLFFCYSEQQRTNLLGQLGDLFVIYSWSGYCSQLHYIYKKKLKIILKYLNC